MKKIRTIIILILVLFSSISFAANPSKEINSKCRKNIRLLNTGTALAIKQNSNINIPKWGSLKQALSTFLDKEKHLEGKEIVGPTPDCEYYIVSLSKDDYQWLCNLHGVIDGEHSVSLQYHEYLLQGKTCKKYESNENYKKHLKDMIRWTEYTLTPKEFFMFHYNQNPIVTTVLSIILVVVSFILLKSFFKF